MVVEVSAEPFSSKDLFRAAHIKRIERGKLFEGTVDSHDRKIVVPAYIVFQGLNEWKEWFRDERKHRDSNEKYIPELNINSAGRRMQSIVDPMYDMRVEDKIHRFRAPYVLIFGTEEESGFDGKFLMHGSQIHDSKRYSRWAIHADPEPEGLEVLINLEDEKVRSNFVEVLRNKGNPMPFSAEFQKVKWDSEFDWYLNGWRRQDNERFGLFDGTKPIESMERIGDSETVTLTDFTYSSAFKYELKNHKKTLQCMHVSRETTLDHNFLFEMMVDLRKVGFPIMNREEEANYIMVEKEAEEEEAAEYGGLARWDNTAPRKRR